MEVKPGYKQTEVGVIPEEWEVKLLGSLATTVASGRTTSWSDFGSYPVHGSTGVIGYTEKPAYEGDAILVARVGAYAGKLNTVGGKYGVTDNTIMLRFSTGCLLSYLWRTLESKRLNRLVFGSGQPLITGTQLKMLPLAYPPPPEQRAIAEALSDVDGLLGGLDRLIAKKRDLKQAAMQQLLTGQTRLPGYSGEWETKRLGDRVTRLPKTKRLSSDGELEGRYPFFTNSTQPVDRYLNEKDFDQEAIIANTGGVAYFDYFNGPFAAMADCMVLSAQDNAKWLFYLLKTLEPFINNTGFTGSGIKHLDKEFFFGLNVHIATSPEEQAAIAGTLTAMDAELGALVARRDKTRALKHGMMQELLTGRTRLVPVEVRHA
jgi:type I restriction enzyme S subunit